MNAKVDLVLNVVSYKGIPPSQPQSVRVSGDSCVAGRHPSCQLELPDPERETSGYHALINRRDDGYWLTDISTNGTFLNDAEEPLDPSRPVDLQHGDRLTMGLYVVEISFVRSPDASTDSAVAGSPSPQPDGLRDVAPCPDILDLIGSGPAEAPPSPTASVDEDQRPASSEGAGGAIGVETQKLPLSEEVAPDTPAPEASQLPEHTLAFVQSAAPPISDLSRTGGRTPPLHAAKEDRSEDVRILTEPTGAAQSKSAEPDQAPEDLAFGLAPLPTTAQSHSPFVEAPEQAPPMAPDAALTLRIPSPVGGLAEPSMPSSTEPGGSPEFPDQALASEPETSPEGLAGDETLLMPAAGYQTPWMFSTPDHSTSEPAQPSKESPPISSDADALGDAARRAHQAEASNPALETPLEEPSRASTPDAPTQMLRSDEALPGLAAPPSTEGGPGASAPSDAAADRSEPRAGLQRAASLDPDEQQQQTSQHPSAQTDMRVADAPPSPAAPAAADRIIGPPLDSGRLLSTPTLEMAAAAAASHPEPVRVEPREASPEFGGRMTAAPDQADLTKIFEGGAATRVRAEHGDRPRSPLSPTEAGHIEAFLGGLGAGTLAEIENPEQLMRRSGELLRVMTQGLMAMSLAQESLKSDLQVMDKRVDSNGHNPFHFCLDLDDTLARLLWRPESALLESSGATQKSVDNLQTHQTALLAGLRGVIKALLARLEPHSIEQEVEGQSGLGHLVPNARKAKCWDRFVSAFDEIADDALEDLVRRFQAAFHHAYDDAIERSLEERRHRWDESHRPGK